MKIRNGFVSNSSSSSFCIIGTGDRRIVQAAAKKLKITDGDFGHGGADPSGDTLFTFVGTSVEEATFGMNAPDLLETMTMSQAKDHVRQAMRALLGDQVPLNLQVEFEYGECSSE